MWRLVLISSILLCGCVKPANPQGPSEKADLADMAEDVASDIGMSDTDRRNNLDPTDLDVGDFGDTGESPNSARFTSIALADRAACALERTGRVYCWGANVKSLLLEDATMTVEKLSPFLRNNFPAFESLSAGRNHICGVVGESVVCWGDNGLRQSLFSPDELVLAPAIPAIQDVFVRTIGTGRVHNCAVDETGEVTCWGVNAFGILDPSGSFPGCVDDNDCAGGEACYLSECASLFESEPVAENLDVVDIAVGDDHTCVLDRARDVYCWGRNSDGRAVPGLGEMLVTEPTLVPGGFDAIDASTFTCAVTGRRVVCWGAPTGDQTGATPGDPLPQNEDVMDVVVGDAHGCALLSSGSARCWGRWTETGGPAASTEFTAPNGEPFLVIAAGKAVTCASTRSELYCWGDNTADGLVGQFDADEPIGQSYSTPTAVRLGP